MATIKRTDSKDPDFRKLIPELDKDLRSRYGTQQDVYDQFNKIESLHTVVVAYEGGQPIGCGCFKKFDEFSVEIKRMFVEPAQRGKGVASSILRELENWARELDNTHTVLETGDQQVEAIALYKKKGYNVIANYGQYADISSSICMSKKL